MTWDQGMVEGYQADSGGPVFTLVRSPVDSVSKGKWDPVSKFDQRVRRVLKAVQELHAEYPGKQ